MKTKSNVKELIDTTQYRLDTLERQFKERSELFTWQSTHGGGVKNIHILDTIRSLECLYKQIAYHTDLLRTLKDSK